MAIIIVAIAIVPTAVSCAGPDGDEIARLVKQLGDDDFARREDASKRLIEIGQPALDALHKATACSDAEVRRRAEEAVAAIEGRLDGGDVVLELPKDTILSFAAPTPDGEHIITAAIENDGVIRRWNAVSKKEESRTQAWVMFCHNPMSVDGKQMAAADRQAVYVWDTQTGKELHRWGWTDKNDDVFLVAVVPDGKLLTLNRDSVRLCDIRDGKKLRDLEDSSHCVIQVHGVPPVSLIVTPDGRLASATTNDGVVRLWDLETGKIKRTFKANRSEVYCVRFSPDGGRLLTEGDDGTVCLWDVKTGKEHCRFDMGKEVTLAFAFAPDGRRLLLGEGGGVRLFDAETGKELHRYGGHEDKITSVAFYADGKRFLSASDEGKVRVWNIWK
jgi:WD40 repeat protein